MVGPTRVIAAARLVGIAVVDKPAYSASHGRGAGTGRASCKRPSYKGVFTVRSLRSWFTEDRASSVAPTYTNQILGQTFEAVRGIDGIRATAAFRGSLTLIGHAAGVASLSGQHSGALQGHLSTIARSMVSTGQSDWLINVGITGGGGVVAVLGVGCSWRGDSRQLGLLGDVEWAEPDGDDAAERRIDSQLQTAGGFTNAMVRQAGD